MRLLADGQVPVYEGRSDSENGHVESEKINTGHAEFELQRLAREKSVHDVECDAIAEGNMLNTPVVVFWGMQHLTKSTTNETLMKTMSTRQLLSSTRLYTLSSLVVRKMTRTMTTRLRRRPSDDETYETYL